MNKYIEVFFCVGFGVGLTLGLLFGILITSHDFKTEAIKNKVAVYRIVDQEIGKVEFTWLNPTNTP